MLQNKESVSAGSPLVGILIVASALLLKLGFIYNNTLYWGLLVTIPLLLIELTRRSRVTRGASSAQINSVLALYRRKIIAQSKPTVSQKIGKTSGQSRGPVQQIPLPKFHIFQHLN